MYKYTPKEQILKEIQRAFGKQKKNLMYDLQSKLNEIFKKFHCKPPFCSFSISKYCNAVYYSKTKLKHVPVHGVLVPVVLFNEEYVDNQQT